MQYQPLPTLQRREQAPWMQYAAAVAAAVGVVAFASSMLPRQSSSSQMWTAAGTTTRPMVGMQTAPLMYRTAATRSADPAMMESVSMPAQSATQTASIGPQPGANSPLLAGGWMAIGAGVSLLVLAIANARQRLGAVPMQSVAMPQQTSMAMAAVAGYKTPPADLKLHVYDHCPYCTRVELFLGWNGIKYERILYGYGDMEGPKYLTGKKQLPVLQGTDVYNPKGMIGLPESMDIVAWCVQEYGCVLPPTTGRSDIADWQKRAKAPIAALSRPRMIKMPYRDWAMPEDIEYAFGKWKKKTGFVADEALAQTPALLQEMEVLLEELEGMLKGSESVNPWGLGMDDIILLPDLRRLTCVKGLKWPAKVENYVNKALAYPAMQCVSYAPLAF